MVEQAAAEGITVNRVSQGSGAMLLSGSELRELAAIGAEHGLEVSLFVGPREELRTSASRPVARRPAHRAG